MSHNPYSPPTAEVADVAVAHSMEKPVQVVWAVRLLWSSVVLSFVRDIVQFGYIWSMGELPTATLVGGLIGGLIGFLIAMWFIGKVSAGRNWARIVILVLMLLGIASLPMLWPYLGAATPIQLIVGATQQVLTLVVLILVFTSPGKFWFRPRE
jgi:hypothetical protein